MKSNVFGTYKNTQIHGKIEKQKDKTDSQILLKKLSKRARPTKSNVLVS